MHRMRKKQSDGVLLEVPHFASIYKSKKNFGLSLGYDAPRNWNDLPDLEAQPKCCLHSGTI